MRTHRYEWSGSWGRIARRDPALLWAIEIVERDRSHGDDGQDQSDCAADECAEERERSEGGRRRWRPRFWLFCPGFWLIGLAAFASVATFASAAVVAIPAGGW